MTGFPSITVRWERVPADTARRGVAWRLLRSVVGNPAALITNVCSHCGGPHGPVQIPGASVVASVTYAGGFAIVAVAEAQQAKAIGVDGESVSDPRRNAAGMRGIIRPGVSSSLREWTRVEAVLKADGRGLRVAPAAVSLKDGDGGWSASIEDSRRSFTGWDVAGPPGVLVSVAIEPLP